MGDKSEILDSLSKWSTSSVLAVALVFMVWMDHRDETNWDARLAGIMERQAASQERHEETAKKLAETLIELLGERE